MKPNSVFVIGCLFLFFFVSCAAPNPRRINGAYDDFAVAVFEGHERKGFTVNGLVIMYSQGKKTIAHGQWNTGLENSSWKDYEILIMQRNHEQAFDLTPHISAIEIGQVTRWKLEVSETPVSFVKYHSIIVKYKKTKIGSALIHG